MVSSAIWNDEKFQPLTQDTKLLLLYLITCPHGNMVGLYVLKNLYACADLGWGEDKYKLHLNDLIRAGFVEYDDSQQVILIRKQLKSDPIESNRNNVKGAIFQIEKVPATYLKQILLQILTENAEWGNRKFAQELTAYLRRTNGVVTALPTAYERRPNSVAVTGSVTVTEKLLIVGSKQPLDPTLQSSAEKKSDTKAKLRTEATQVLEFLNEKTGSVFRPVDNNLSKIEAILKTGVTVQDCKYVIANRVMQWGNKPEMQEYLRISTLFRRSNFEQYIAIIEGNKKKMMEDINK